MLDFFSQLRLKRKGFSSGKKRRKQTDNELLFALQEGWPIRAFLFFLFAAGISIVTALGAEEGAIFDGEALKAVFVIGLICLTLLIHFYVNLPESFARNSRVLLLLAVIATQLGFLKLTAFLMGAFGLGDNYQFLAFPYALAPMIMSVLLGRNHGTFVAIYASLFGGLLVSAEEAFPFIVFSLICGFIAVYLTHQVRRRGRLIRAGVYVGLACIVIGFALGTIQLPFGNTSEEWELLGLQCFAALLTSFLSAMVVSGTLPIFEGLFFITTDISWIEKADLNHPLLKRMTLEAPGTYHHSLVVANLSEAAAESIGANATMCRVCSYFHDIGKLNKPEYYIENIAEGENPHDELTPTMSALIVIAHVKDGVDIALKNNLNREIINVIREHHGTTLIYYFYHRALKLREEVEEQVAAGNEREEDIPDVKEEGFRYPGPKPQTRESAIISLADAVESASRSLVKPTPQKIEQLIDEIVRNRLHDGQLDECALTLSDLAKVKRSFSVTLRSMMHNRISYPKEDKEDRTKGGRDASLKEKSEAKANPKTSRGEKKEPAKTPAQV